MGRVLVMGMSPEDFAKLRQRAPAIQPPVARPIITTIGMIPIQFFAQGAPKGQPRPKAFARGGIASVYDPGTAEGWKSQVAIAARPFLPATPYDLPLCVHLEFFFPRPKGHYHSGKRAAELRESAPGYHLGKPDADNAAKAVMDALTVLRMWKDDSIVAHLIVRKLYEDFRGPGCLVRISEG